MSSSRRDFRRVTRTLVGPGENFAKSSCKKRLKPIAVCRKPACIMASVIALPDYHVHTFRCGHAGGDSRGFVRRAIERGLSEMAFTDHLPLYFLPPDQPGPAFAVREDQLEDYPAEAAASQRQ